MDIRVQVYQHKKTGAIRVADHPPGQIKDWVELYHFIHEINETLRKYNTLGVVK